MFTKLAVSAIAALMAISSAAYAASAQESPKYNKPGFVAFVDDGRLWVFRVDSEELAAFKTHGEPVKQATRIGVGPEGMTVRSGDIDTVDAYLAAK